MRLKVTQAVPPAEWNMICSVEIPDNLPNRLLSIGKGTFTVSMDENGELVLSLHN